MAALTTQQRRATWSEIMERLSRNREVVDLTKDDLRAAVNAADDWIEANASAYNLALPLISQTNLTNRQKAMLLMFVINRRFGVL